MKTLRFWLLVPLLIFVMSCRDEVGEELEEVVDEQREEEVDESDGQDKDGLYFPPINSQEWETTNVDALGWDAAALQEAVDFAQARNSYNLMILHRGRIVSENYWQEAATDSTFNLESVGKSMTAFVVGILEEQFDFSVNDYVSDHLGEGWSKAPVGKEALIQVKHLLSMSSGLDYELNYLADAGTKWYYSNAAYEKLLDVITAVSGAPYETYFDDVLFSRIGMTQVWWKNHNIRTNARDMARFGLMILAEGKWESTPIMNNARYYNEMLSTSQDLQPPYGYLWWLNGKSSFFDDVQMIEGPISASMPADGLLAKGHHDQRIEIIPSLDLVVVRQGGPTGFAESGTQSFDHRFWELLMRAMPRGQSN